MMHTYMYMRVSFGCGKSDLWWGFKSRERERENWCIWLLFNFGLKTNVQTRVLYSHCERNGIGRKKFYPFIRPFRIRRKAKAKARAKSCIQLNCWQLQRRWFIAHHFLWKAVRIVFLPHFIQFLVWLVWPKRQRRDELTQKCLVCLHNIHKHNVVHAQRPMNGLAFGFNILSVWISC